MLWNPITPLLGDHEVVVVSEPLIRGFDVTVAHESLLSSPGQLRSFFISYLEAWEELANDKIKVFNILRDETNIGDFVIDEVLSA